MYDKKRKVKMGYIEKHDIRERFGLYDRHGIPHECESNLEKIARLADIVFDLEEQIHLLSAGTVVKQGEDGGSSGVWRMDYIRKWYQKSYGDLEDVDDGYDVCNVIWLFLKQNVKPPYA